MEKIKNLNLKTQKYVLLKIVDLFKTKN